MLKRVRSGLVLAALTSSLIGAAPREQAGVPRLTSDLFREYSARSIGPGAISGRIADIEIDPRNPSVWYVASAFGGLWKTENRGITFKPIFDGDDATFTLCCVVVDPKD